MSKVLELANSLCPLFEDQMLELDDVAEAAAELRRLAAIEAAARNLVKVKGRYHTEQAFKALAATLENHHG